jgi:hypothetical protein
VTVSETLVVCVALVPVPVTVTVYVPGAVAAPTVNVSVELPPAVTGVGLNVAVVPLGTPLAVSDTVWADPLVTAVEIVVLTLAPCCALTLAGLAVIEKSLGGAAGQPGSLNVPMRVRQLNVPFTGMYSFVYQNVQSSAGSTVSAL